MSVGLEYKSVISFVPSLITCTSRKLIFSLDHSAVNFIELCSPLRKLINSESFSSPCKQTKNMSSIKRHQMNGLYWASSSSFSSNAAKNKIA